MPRGDESDDRTYRHAKVADAGTATHPHRIGGNASQGSHRVEKYTAHDLESRYFGSSFPRSSLSKMVTSALTAFERVGEANQGEFYCRECKQVIDGSPRVQVIGGMGDLKDAPHLGCWVILCERDRSLPKYSDREASRSGWFDIHRIGPDGSFSSALLIAEPTAD